MSALVRAGVLVAALALLLGVSSGVGVILAQETEIAVGDQVVVNNGTLKLRAEPSVQAETVEVLAEGTTLSVIGGPESADGLTWLQVRTSGGTEGWVSSEYVEWAPPVPPEIGDTVAVVLGPLNLRESATEDASIVGKLEQDARVVVVDGPVSSGNYTWYQVESEKGETGWIASDYIRIAPPKGFEPGSKVVVGTGPVNMRVGASVDTEVLETIEVDTTLTIVSGPVSGDDLTWFEIETEAGESGFVVATSLEAVAGGEIEPIDFPIGSFIFAAEATEARASGMIDAAAVASLQEGDMATVTEGPVVADGFTWFQVTIGEGEDAITGWVQGESMTGGIVVGTDAIVADGPLNLRESASSDAQTVDLLEQGDTVNLVSGPQVVEGVAWFEVTAGDDTGFVAGRYLGQVTIATPTAEATQPSAEATATPGS